MERAPEVPKITVVGACNIDLISYVPRLPVENVPHWSAALVKQRARVPS